MKKVALILFLVVVSATGVFAKDFNLDDFAMSAGAGVSFFDFFTVYDGSDGSDFSRTTANVAGFTFNGFFDATYVMATAGFAFNVGGKLDTKYDINGFDDSDVVDLDQYMTYLEFGLYGKYPFQVGNFTLFPLLGVSARLNLSCVDEDGDDLKGDMSNDQANSLSQFWIKFGAGADFNLTDKFYIRPVALIGFKIPSKWDMDQVEDLKDDPYNFDNAYCLSMNFELGVYVGYRF